MPSESPTAPVSKQWLWAGRIMGGVVVLFLLFDSVIHLLRIAPVVAAFAQLGYPVSVARALGVLELVCVVLYLIPRTSVLGAILLAGYLGGAVATQLRIDSPLFSTVLFPVYVGVILWGALYLRDDRLRALIPLRS